MERRLTAFLPRLKSWVSCLTNYEGKEIKEVIEIKEGKEIKEVIEIKEGKDVLWALYGIVDSKSGSVTSWDGIQLKVGMDGMGFPTLYKKNNNDIDIETVSKLPKDLYRNDIVSNICNISKTTIISKTTMGDTILTLHTLPQKGDTHFEVSKEGMIIIMRYIAL
jgi:hypothetical protein